MTHYDRRRSEREPTPPGLRHSQQAASTRLSPGRANPGGPQPGPVSAQQSPYSDSSTSMAAYERRPPPSVEHAAISRFASPLPGVQPTMTGVREAYDGRGLPPIQLPPMRSLPPASQPPPRRDPNHTMSVTSLLSRNPESPSRSQRTPLPTSRPTPSAQSYAQGQPAYHSPPNVYESSPNEGHTRMPPVPLAPPHYMDQPPQPHREPHPQRPMYPSQPFPGAQPRFPRPPSESDVPHHSPATSYGQSPAQYAASSESSPTGAYAPSYPEPAQPIVSQPPPLNYTLTIRQQPAAARACGYGERDRRVIDPPPILELKTTNKATGAPESDEGCMLAIHCTLLNKDGVEDDGEAAQGSSDGPASRRLMGTLVASPYGAKDENGRAGTFFVFSDLSCRNPGKYRLKFTLIRLDATCMLPGTKHPTVAHITTDVFSVYTAKDFPGMRASSALLIALRKQGLNVGVKKGSDARYAHPKPTTPSTTEDDDDDDNIAPCAPLIIRLRVI